MAVGVVIGAAFNSVVQALVKDIITPLIAAIGGQPDFSAMSATVHNSKILYGDFLNALISFLVVGSAVYFFVVVPVTRISNRFKKPEAQTPPKKKCPFCLSEIPDAAKKCAYCTADL